MKDQIFTGRSVSEAVEVAGRTLGLAPDAIRYVILERETPGALGMEGAPARIAVLLERGRPGPVSPAASVAPAARPEPPKDVRAAIRGFIRDLAELGGLDLTAEVEEDEHRTIVRLFGGDREVLLEEDGEVFVAVEHILQRAFSQAVHPRRFAVESEGYRETRDAALSARARELAESVRDDGHPRETEPLNSYERRLVHMAVAEVAGVRTFSVGEGADRRVTIARAEDAPASKAGDANSGGLEG